MPHIRAGSAAGCSAPALSRPSGSQSRTACAARRGCWAVGHRNVERRRTGRARRRAQAPHTLVARIETAPRRALREERTVASQRGMRRTWVAHLGRRLAAREPHTGQQRGRTRSPCATRMQKFSGNSLDACIPPLSLMCPLDSILCCSGNVLPGALQQHNTAWEMSFPGSRTRRSSTSGLVWICFKSAFVQTSVLSYQPPPPSPPPTLPRSWVASSKVTAVRCPRDRRPALFGRDEVVKPYSSPPPAPPPEELAYSFVPEPPRTPTDYRQPMWRWMLQDVGRRTVGVARVDLIRPRSSSVGPACPIRAAGTAACKTLRHCGAR